MKTTDVNGRKTEQAKKNKLPAEHNDHLTELYNEAAIKSNVDEYLRKNQKGALILMDVYGFNVINAQYGHLAGDGVLREFADILKNMFFQTAIAGRIGGARFVLFLTAGYDLEDIEKKLSRLNLRIQQLGKSLKTSSDLSMDTGITVYQDGDCYRDMFSRARESLMDKQSPYGEGLEIATYEERALSKDMSLIWKDLSEKTKPDGAYCNDYEQFKSIYRFVERGLARTPNNVYAALMTITDNTGHFIQLNDRERLMPLLNDIIQGALRGGDVYTRYSSCQYILMLIGASLDNTKKVADRIKDLFSCAVRNNPNINIEYGMHPLKPFDDRDEEGGKNNNK